MRRALFAILVGLVLASLACGGEDSAVNDVPFDTARAMADIEFLAGSIGPRPAGSEAAGKAAEYIGDQFSRAAFGVFYTTFSFELDANRPASLRVGSQAFTGVTARGSAAGTATGVGVEFGAAETLEPGAIAGKVAVTSRGGAAFAETAQAARRAGAVALVIATAAPGELLADLGTEVPIPVVTVSGPDGGTILMLARRGETFTVDVSPARTAEGRNVVARSVTAGHTCIYLLTANFDSLPSSAGANENAAGVAVLLELARQFGQLDDIPPVCFVAFDAGYSGSRGAEHYARTQVSSSSPPAFAISLQRIGAGAELAAYGDTFLRSEARDVAEALGIELQTPAGAPAASTDATPFRDRGVPTLELVRSGSRVANQPSEIDKDALREAGAMASRLLIRMSTVAAP